jgi:hypothetical protein
VRLLYGGETTTESVALRIYGDATGTPNQGSTLFIGDYARAGMNDSFEDEPQGVRHLGLSGSQRLRDFGRRQEAAIEIGVESHHIALEASRGARMSPNSD